MSRRLADVARKVGVSEATVSRVLNDKPGVGASTRAAVLTALDAVIVRPLLARLVLEGEAGQAGSTELVHSTEVVPQRTTVGTAGAAATLRSYDRAGVLVEERAITGATKVTVRAGGFVVVER